MICANRAIGTLGDGILPDVVRLLDLRRDFGADSVEESSDPNEERFPGP
jgi:hypothetical protein